MCTVKCTKDPANLPFDCQFSPELCQATVCKTHCINDSQPYQDLKNFYYEGMFIFSSTVFLNKIYNQIPLILTKATYCHKSIHIIRGHFNSMSWNLSFRIQYIKKSFNTSSYEWKNFELGHDLETKNNYMSVSVLKCFFKNNF